MIVVTNIDGTLKEIKQRRTPRPSLVNHLMAAVAATTEVALPDVSMPTPGMQHPQPQMTVGNQSFRTITRHANLILINKRPKHETPMNSLLGRFQDHCGLKAPRMGGNRKSWQNFQLLSTKQGDTRTKSLNTQRRGTYFTKGSTSSPRQL